MYKSLRRISDLKIKNHIFLKVVFGTLPGIWAHGDFCMIDPETGGVWMLGRR